MYKRTFWQDHVVDEGTGEIMQQGTPQSASNFNNLEEGVFTSDELAAVVAQQVRQHGRALDKLGADLVTGLDGLAEELDAGIAALDGEIGEVVLTNTQEYPFNNSVKTVSLSKPRDTLNYRVIIEIVASTGMPGGIRVFDKQLNGFKVAFTGSATSTTIKYYVQGGVYQ